MAEYRVQTKDITKIGVDFTPGLCQGCKSRDCEMPIEKREVALPIVGIRKLKVLVSGRRVGIVTACDGYIGK